MRTQRRSLSPTVPKDEGFKRIQYERYADDFIIGVIGSKADALAIKQDVGNFLHNVLKLEMSDAKTKITHTANKARFLGFDISVCKDQTPVKVKNGRTARTHNGKVKLLVPREKWINKLLEKKAIDIKKNGNGAERFRALHRGELVNKEDYEILFTYNSEIRGMANFYSIANNAWRLGKFTGLMEYSMLKTFACKYRTNVASIKKKYVKNGRFTVTYYTKNGIKEATLFKEKTKNSAKAIQNDNINIINKYYPARYANSIIARIRKGVCELCDKKSSVLEVHLVRKLKDITGNKEWEIRMRKIRRKTLAVCPECHQLIHTQQ